MSQITPVTLTVVVLFDQAVISQRSVEIGHKRGDVLGRGQPIVNMLAGVNKTARSHREVSDIVPVEWEVEAQFQRLKK